MILVAALPLKFYEMNYYWMAILPPLCVLVGLGGQMLYERLRPGPAPVRRGAGPFTPLRSRRRRKRR